MFEIRTEEPDDYAGIREVHVRTFGGDEEANLVELLRNRTKASIALVALSAHRVVGHIMFSPVSISSAAKDFRAIGLAPLAVLPGFQNRGIGSQLTQAGLDACRKLGYDVVVVLGHPGYYRRFGFLKARDYGLDNEYNAQEAFMVMELMPDVLRGLAGLVQYAPEFREAGC